MAEGTRHHHYLEGKFTEIDSYNDLLEGRFQKFEDGFESFKVEVANQLFRLHNLISATMTKGDQEEETGMYFGVTTN